MTILFGTYRCFWHGTDLETPCPGCARMACSRCMANEIGHQCVSCEIKANQETQPATRICDLCRVVFSYKRFVRSGITRRLCSECEIVSDLFDLEHDILDTDRPLCMDVFFSIKDQGIKRIDYQSQGFFYDVEIRVFLDIICKPCPVSTLSLFRRLSLMIRNHLNCGIVALNVRLFS